MEFAGGKIASADTVTLMLLCWHKIAQRRTWLLVTWLLPLIEQECLAFRPIGALTNKPEFHLARLDTTRIVRRVVRVETSESSMSSRAVPTWRTTNKL